MKPSQKIAAAAATVALGGAAAWALRSWSRDKPGSEERERIGYPPLDTLKPVGEDVWVVDSGPISASGLSIPVRMTVMRLSDGALLLHSPSRMTDSLEAELRRLGPVVHMVAPTTAHWTFLPEWQEAFPDAKVWAVPGLRERAQVQLSDLRIDHDLDERAPQAWAAEIEQGLVRGAGFEEAYFFHRPSGTLVLTDLIQNLESHKLPPVTAAFAKLARATEGRTAAHVRAATALGGEEAKERIRYLVSLQPEKVIFAHGSWFETDGAERLRQAFRWAL